MLHFTIYHNEEHIKTYEIDSTSLTVGRLPENDIPIASISVSRRHFNIEQDETHQYNLTDLNSLNGTYVNNQKVSLTKLNDGDKITIGKYTILFEIMSEDSDMDETAVHQKKEIDAPVKTDDKKNAPKAKKTKEKDEDVIEIDTDTPQENSTETPVLIETNKHVVYKIDKSVMSIGSSENDDIFVEGFLISDGHVLIEIDDKGTWIHANKFMGKIKINGKKVNKHKLKHKDQIEIGTSVFRYMENGHE
jgi:pSer/pThr/pTyr-binding forkhead associated (FHA) protein